MTTVLVFGTFDLFHAGHEFFLREAAKHGERLVVVIARDVTVECIKGRSPKQSEEERCANIARFECVHAAVLGRTDDKYAIIEVIRPDVICLGYDQRAFTERLAERLAERGLTPRIVRLGSYKPEVFKTSKFRRSRT